MGQPWARGLEGPYSLYGLWASHGPAMGQPWAGRAQEGSWAMGWACTVLYRPLYRPIWAMGWAGPGPYGPIWAMAHMGHMGLYGPGPAQQALQW